MRVNMERCSVGSVCVCACVCVCVSVCVCSVGISGCISSGAERCCHLYKGCKGESVRK